MSKYRKADHNTADKAWHEYVKNGGDPEDRERLEEEYRDDIGRDGNEIPFPDDLGERF